MLNLKIDILCSGSKGNSVLVRTDKTSILIDCGSTKKYLQSAFREVGQDPDDLDALLITHGHSDHTSQLKMFQTIPTYAWCELKKGFDRICIQPEVAFSINELTITPFSLSHDADKTVGYLIENEKEKLVYCTDTGYIRQDAFKLLSNADYYVFESNHDVAMLMNTNRPYYLKQRILGDYGHLNNEASANYLCKFIGDKTKAIILAHISEEANTPHIALLTLKQALVDHGIDYSNIQIEAAMQKQIVHIKGQ